MRYITGTLRDLLQGGETHLRDFERFYDREVRHILGTLRDLRYGGETHLRVVDEFDDWEMRHISEASRI